MRKYLSILCLSSCLFFSQSSFSQTGLGFNGTNNYVSTAAYVVPVTGNFTVEFWAYIPVLGSGLREFVSQGSSTAGQNFYIGTDFGGNDIRCGDPWQATGVVMPVGQWTHIAMVKSGTTAYLYLNGILKATKLSYGTLSTGGTFFLIGTQYGGLSEYTNGSIDQVRIWNVALTVAQIKSGMDRNVAVNSAGLVAYYKLNEGSGTTAANSTATAGLNGTLVNSPSWIATPVEYKSNALNFDGTDDQVIAPAASQYDLSTGTVECWINPAVLDVINRHIVGNRSISGSRYSFHISSTAIGLWNGTTYATIPYTASTGTWYHLAFVCDGTQTKVYVNGTLAGTIALAFNTSGSNTLVFGISKNTNGTQSEPFSGSIDEVRIWSTQRTQAQIQANMGVTLLGDEAGLVGLFSFSQGIPGGANSSFGLALDNTSYSNHGTLSNFALSGSTSNFVAHTLALLPVVLADFSVNKQNNMAVLQWQTAQEQNSRLFNIERSPDGQHYTLIGSVNAAGNSNSVRSYTFTDAAPQTGVNYYRLKQVDIDAHFTYSDVRVLDFAAPRRLTWWLAGENTVKIQLAQGGDERFTVTDMSGRGLQKGQLSGGNASIPALKPGIYVIRVTTASGDLQTQVVVPQ